MLTQTRTQHEALVQACEVERPPLDAALRTDMDQIVSSKEHVTGRMRGKSRLIQQRNAALKRACISERPVLDVLRIMYCS